MDSRPVYLQGRGRGRGRGATGFRAEVNAYQNFSHGSQQYEASVPNKENFTENNYYNGTFGGTGSPRRKQVLPTRQSNEGNTFDGRNIHI